MGPIFFYMVDFLKSCMYNNFMTTVDSLLDEIINVHLTPVESKIPNRDLKVLKGISSSIKGPHYITENQSNLLLKILQTHIEKFPTVADDILAAVAEPEFLRPFRKIEAYRRLRLDTNKEGDQQIFIEFTFSSEMRKFLVILQKTLQLVPANTSGNQWSLPLTEANIVKVVDLSLPLNFTIDENLKNYYDTIKSWSKTEFEDQFSLTNLTNASFQKAISDDLGIETTINDIIIKDRSVRYNYFTKKSEKNPENLVEKIAYRETTRVWVDPTKYKFEEILESLVTLKRFPLLVVFDSFDAKHCFENLTKFSENLEKIGIFDNVGIYFRFANDDAGKKINHLIADKKYNSRLDENTKIVAVTHNKIPKFLLKTTWQPMSVLSFTTNLTSTKTGVYANCCDLIISYTDKEPLIDGRFKWQ